MDRPSPPGAPAFDDRPFDALFFDERWDLLLEPAARRLARARAGASPEGLARALEIMAIVVEHRGGPAQAASLCGEAYRLRKRLGDPDGLATTAGQLIRHLALAGDLSRALQLIPRAMRAYRAAGAALDGFLLLAHLGRELMERGRFPAACLILEKALPDAPHRYPCWGRVGVLEHLAIALERSGRLAEALQAALGAERALAGLGFPEVEAHLRARARRLAGRLGHPAPLPVEDPG